jgi:choline-sulfatase
MEQHKNDRPNILFVLTDDQGPWAMSCAGNDDIITPNLDALAASGTRFENFFCTSPVCSPARASLLTGKIPSQHGVLDWIREGNDGEDCISYLSGHTGYTEYLQAAGYTCGLSGKWHLGCSHVPQMGMSHWYAHQKGSDHYYHAPMYRDGVLERDPGYVTDLITDDAVEFMRARHAADDRFYCGVHYTAPHGPWGRDEHPADVRTLYADCEFPTCPREPFHPLAAYRFDEANFRECLIGYFTAVTAMDAGIGRLIACLEELGIREDTLVFFVSDNGFNCGHHGIWGKGNGTLVPNMFDTSVKVPAIASHPGVIPAGVVSGAMISGYDFMPTLLDYVGIDATEDSTLPGVSRSPEFLGHGHDSEKDIVVFDEYGPVRMIRTREWKYVHRYGTGGDELYDLRRDPGERSNLVDEVSTKATIGELHGRLERWFVRYVDPSLDASKEPVRGAGQTGLVGQKSAGLPVFVTEREVSFDPSHDPGMDSRNKP